MSMTAAQVKGRIKQIASQCGADPRILMRMHMMERFIERLSKSRYRNSFVIKGGLLVSSMVGVSLRSTMDIDATAVNWNLTEEKARSIIENIAAISLDDNISFSVVSVEKIMDEMEYPGIRICMNSTLENMCIPIKVDISTGDAITPGAVEYQYKLLLESRCLSLWSYNLETVLAESWSGSEVTRE